MKYLTLILGFIALGVGLYLGYLFLNSEGIQPDNTLSSSLSGPLQPEQIEDWSSYSNDTSVNVGAGDCGDADAFALLTEFNSGERLVLDLPSGLPLVTTPNPHGWDTESFLLFGEDETAFCAAGGIYPLWAYPDRLLWKGVCSTGREPEMDSSDYQKFLACVRDEQTIESYYSIKDPYIYGIVEGALMHIAKDGSQRTINEGPFTHLFYAEGDIVWVGYAAEETHTDPAAFPTYAITLSQIRANGEIIQQATHSSVDQILYGPVSKRFVVLNARSEESSSDDTWENSVAILDKNGVEQQRFSLKDALWFQRPELPDGTILIAQKNQSLSNDRVFTSIAANGEREALTYSLSGSSDTVTHLFNIPITIEAVQIGFDSFAGRVLRLDTDSASVYTPLSTLSDVHSIADSFLAHGSRYAVLSTGTYPTDWQPCDRLFEIGDDTAQEVIGSVAFVRPTPNGFIYGEPLDSCTRVRVWQTDTNGENAGLLLESYDIPWQAEPFLVAG